MGDERCRCCCWAIEREKETWRQNMQRHRRVGDREADMGQKREHNGALGEKRGRISIVRHLDKTARTKCKDRK